MVLRDLRLRALTLAAAALLALAAAPAAAQAPDTARLRVEVAADQAGAVLAAAETAARGAEPDSAAWERIWRSEGFVRLAARDSTFGRPIARDSFAAFVRSPELAARLPALRRTLDAWRDVDAREAAAAALAYLPEGTALRARIYPVVKPRENSFVWELDTDPAIFLYLDETVSPAAFRNTLAHELHHVGNAAVCPRPDPATPAEEARGWMSGFGEGVATLAAAGGPDVHPHETGSAADRAVWDRDVARWEEDLVALDAFLLDVARRRAGGAAAARVRGMAFVVSDSVPQGPFYTVGWTMAALVERELGRAPVIAASCDPAALLHAYQRAAALADARDGRRRPRFSDALLRLVPPLEDPTGAR